MGHDASKVVLGGTLSSVKESGNRKGLIAAGTVTRLKSDGTLSTALADGSNLGVSLGRDQSGTDFSSIAFRGMSIPLRLGASFTPVIGAVVHISDTTGFGVASGAGATATAATYAAGLKSGIPEGGGAEVPCTLIDMAGGL